MESDFAVYTKDLVKVYEGGKVAVDHLNLEIKYNEIYGLLGRMEQANPPLSKYSPPL
jgi:ABC-type Fe3+/spermidine/putrescine transport system ATPase subunit